MPKLPDSTSLGSVAPVAAESFVNIPVADYQGLGSGLGQAVSNIGTAAGNYGDAIRKKQQAQERFDTRMRLLDGETAYNDRIKDLDPLDPEYVTKKQTARKEVFGPILSNVKDPENKQYFDLSTKEDFVKLGIDAQSEQKSALGKKAEVDVDVYADGLRKKIRTGSYQGDPVAEMNQQINDNPYLDDLQKQALQRKYAAGINADVIDTDFDTVLKTGISVTPNVQAAITAATNRPDVPSWMAGFLARSATIESGGGRNKANPENPDVGGTWQFSTATAKAVGLGDRMDDYAAANAAVKLTMQNYDLLKEGLGREPTPGELYLAHQQGAGGAIALLTNPGASAADVLGKKAVELNLPKSMRDRAGSITAGEFAAHWVNGFNGKAGVPSSEDEVKAMLQATPAFQALDPDQQDVVTEKTLIKFRNEDKSVKLGETRSVVDELVAKYAKPEDRDKAYAELRKRIPDPNYVEDGIHMLDSEYNRADEAKKADDNALFLQTYDKVAAAVSAGDPDTALKAIPEEMDPADKAKLTEFVRKKGGPREDNRWVSDKLIALSVSQDPRDQAEFKSLNIARYVNDLSDETRNSLVSKQQALLNGDKKPGTTFENAQSMINAKLREIGVNITESSEPGDVAVKNRIVALAKRNIEDAESIKGSKLDEDEIGAVFDRTFMQFRGPASKGVFEDSPGDVTSLKDVMTSFAEKENTYGKLPGQLVNEAITDLENSLEQKKFEIQRAIDTARSEKEAAGLLPRLRTRLRRLEQTRIDGSMLNEWLRRYQP